MHQLLRRLQLRPKIRPLQRASWSIQTVDGAGTGSFISLKFNRVDAGIHPSVGNPAISYYGSSSYRLKYAYWNNIWTLQVMDTSGCCSYNSLAIDANGSPQIAYYALAGASGNLKYAKGASLLLSTPELPLGSALTVGATFFAALGFVTYKHRKTS